MATLLNTVSILFRCRWYTDHGHKETKNTSSEQFKYSESSVHPKKLNLDQNIFPTPFKPLTKPVAWTLKITVILMIFAGFYIAFNSEYDLEMEEALMKASPTYERDMKSNPKYVEKIEELRRNRENVKS